MKRLLCVRFPNWSIQRLRNQLKASGLLPSAIALFSSGQSPANELSRSTSPDEDTRFIRKLFVAAQNGPAIVAVSADAWSSGVRPGMPLAEARSMAQPQVSVRPQNTGKGFPSAPQSSVAFYEWQPTVDRSELKLIAELIRRYAPIIGLDDVPMPDSLLLDITGCSHLFGGEAGLAECLLRDLRKAGWNCRIAVAESVSAVWAFTHTDHRQHDPEIRQAVSGRRKPRAASAAMMHELPIQIIPPGQSGSELNPLPVATSRLDLNDLEILKHLGIRSLGQLLSLPREDLPSRLSAQAVIRIQQLAGVVEEAIEPIPEANPVMAAWNSDDPATGLNDVRHILQYLTEQISEQLVRRRMTCSSVACEFRCLDGSLVPLNASVVKPTQSSELLHEVLCLRVETQATHAMIEEANSGNATDDQRITDRQTGQIVSLMSRPFGFVRMMASVGPLPIAKQRDLFSPAEHIVPQEELATLITRLSSRLGSGSITTVRSHADPRPEFSIASSPVLPTESASLRQSALDATLRRLTDPAAEDKIVAGNFPSRPLRLLASPQPITDCDTGRSFPRQLRHAGRTFQLKKFSSPERIQTAWWTDQPVHRDYYIVVTHNDCRLWLFRELQLNKWFLHGIFD